MSTHLFTTRFSAYRCCQGIFIFQKLSQITKWRSDTRYSKVRLSTPPCASLEDRRRAVSAQSDKDDAEAYVVQRYVSNPYLVAGRKFDIRIYALVSPRLPLAVWPLTDRGRGQVTSFSPMTVWLHRSGFCRFSSARCVVGRSLSNDRSCVFVQANQHMIAVILPRYSNSTADLENNFMHLTNVAIQKKSDTYDSMHGGKVILKLLISE